MGVGEPRPQAGPRGWGRLRGDHVMSELKPGSLRLCDVLSYPKHHYAPDNPLKLYTFPQQQQNKELSQMSYVTDAWTGYPESKVKGVVAAT